MEESLQQLLRSNEEIIRTRRALEYKHAGKKIIGVLCPYVPEEIIYAAGMLPWRITGTWRENTPLASVYRPTTSSAYGTHVLEALLSGELDFLDGVVSTNRDQDLVRLFDVWQTNSKTPFTFLMHLPHREGDLAIRQFAIEISRLKEALEKFSRITITPDSLKQAIDEYNLSRKLITGIYDLRKRIIPPLSGSEFLQLTTAAAVIPREEFSQKLETLLPYIQQRETRLKKLRPRILVSSDMLDNPAYIELIEDSACVVAMDDLDTGSRYFWQEVEANHPGGLALGLAQRYLSHPASPHFFSWSKQTRHVVTLAKEFNIQGVIELPLMNDTPRLMRVPYFSEQLKKAGIPVISLLRDYHFANAGQLQTRVEAFLEMLTENTAVSRV